jgi:hypothetical protein
MRGAEGTQAVVGEEVLIQARPASASTATMSFEASAGSVTVRVSFRGAAA